MEKDGRKAIYWNVHNQELTDAVITQVNTLLTADRNEVALAPMLKSLWVAGDLNFEEADWSLVAISDPTKILGKASRRHQAAANRWSALRNLVEIRGGEPTHFEHGSMFPKVDGAVQNLRDPVQLHARGISDPDFSAGEISAEMGAAVE